MGDYFKHASSIVDAGARIGDDTRIWHYTHVSAGAQIGRSCTLGQNVYVAERVTIGDGVKIQNNVSVYDGVTLEDDVFIGPSVVFTNVKAPRAPFPQKRPQGFGTTRVRHGASIGANATIVCGVTIGRWALIGAGAVVTRDVPDHALVVGVPGRQVAWACECGARLSLTGAAAVCVECGRRFVSSPDGLERALAR